MALVEEVMCPQIADIDMLTKTGTHLHSGVTALKRMSSFCLCEVLVALSFLVHVCLQALDRMPSSLPLVPRAAEVCFQAGGRIALPGPLGLGR